MHPRPPAASVTSFAAGANLVPRCPSAASSPALGLGVEFTHTPNSYGEALMPQNVIGRWGLYRVISLK